jgi:homoserine kinase type II
VNTSTFLELEAILAFYDLGTLADLERNERGYVNASFAINTLRDGQKRRYFLRRYKRGIREEELVFEHAVIDHLVEKNFTRVARVMKTSKGRSYVRLEGERGPVFYAIFEFLQGEDKYTWINPACEQREIRSAASLLAEFHNAVFDWFPRGQRYEPVILDLLPELYRMVEGWQVVSQGSALDTYLLENQSRILEAIARTSQFLSRPANQQIVQLVVHCDYHPGNLKFKDGEAVGVFDFDWSKLDARCFDLGLALFYFFSSWEAQTDGSLDLAGLASFLEAYQNALRDVPGVGSLSTVEQACLPWMIEAGSLYVFNWTVKDHLQKEVDVNEYLVYLKHCVNQVYWLEDGRNRERLAAALRAAL